MEFDRRVQVRRYGSPSGRPGFASGYLVGPRLVLTTGHLGDVQGVTVSRPDAGDEEHAAVVRWRRHDERADAALLEIAPDRGWSPPASMARSQTRPSQRWGRLIGPRPYAVTVMGFPRMQKDPAAGRLDEQLTAEIAPGSGSLAHRYELYATAPTLAAPPGPAGATPWAGMSGAAVLAAAPDGALLCGVVRRDREAAGGTRLTATPAAALLADPDFTAVVSEHTGWPPLLEPAEPAPLLAPAARQLDLRSPAMLLRAEAEAVSFHGRERELAELAEWCLDDSAPFAVQVLTGPGGQGKTRLSRHLAERLRRQGWVTGHVLGSLHDGAAPPELSRLDSTLPRLLVVDYAETRPHTVRRLVDHLRTARHHTRLLLLARADGEWRTDALGADAAVRDLLHTATVTPLPPLIPRSTPPRERAADFARAAADFARHLDLLPHLSGRPEQGWPALAGTLRAPGPLTDPRYDSVLTLQMTALTALLQQGTAPVGTAVREPVEATVLSHEQHYWEDTATTPAHRLGGMRTSTLSRAVAVAAACGAATADEAEATAQKIPGLPPEQALPVAEWLHSLYPPPADSYWGSLEPDRVAEYLASAVLAGPSTLVRLLTGASPQQQGRLLTVLVRAALAHYNAQRYEEHERTLLGLDAALGQCPLDAGALRTVTASLPYRTSPTAGLALRLTTALARTLEKRAAADTDAYEPEYATALSNLGVRLSDVGRTEEALAATERAVEIRTRLATADPAAYERDLAESLHKHGILLGALGRRAEALTACERAVEIRRRLAAADPSEHDPELASSLSMLSFRLSAADREGEAVAVAEEAVEIQRRLAAADPAAHEEGLGRLLNNQAVQLSRAGRAAEALAATERAVEIRTRLAKADSAVHERGLARTLSNFSDGLAAAGRWPEAVRAAERAVEIRRRLAAADPALHEAGLARMLFNLSGCLRAAGLPERALDVLDEVAEVCGRLAGRSPAEFAGRLRDVLERQAAVLTELRMSDRAERARARLAALDVPEGTGGFENAP
ncbi:tetratricopeptide repeat protein [Streptomyces sp. NPDC050617]|uniref:tetratricopeptide repeat protein n=1 Tax=Streptomyces sp. NPDC050617 TaxID=3154628 RepID=UPI00342B3694